MAAVGDELVLAHPLGHSELKTAITIVGGPALYLPGNLLFKHAITARWPLSHLIGLGLLAFCALLTPLVAPLLLSAATASALIAVAVLEMQFTRRSRVER